MKTKKIKFIFSLLSVSLLFILFLSSSGNISVDNSKYLLHPDDTINEKGDTIKQASIDILEHILKINNDTNNKPSTTFKKGHVSPASLKAKFKQTDLGFEIQLSNSTTVPTPVVYDGKVYVSGGFGSKQYYSFNAISGELQWAIDLDDDGPSSAAVSDDIIVFNTESCTIFAVDIKTGEQLWSYWLGDPLMCMPTIANGIVFTSYPAHYGGGIYNYDIQNINNPNSNITPKEIKQKRSNRLTHVLAAFDLKTGKILWQKWIDGDVMSAPVAKGDNLYVTSFAGTLYKFNQKDGEILSATASRATSAPVIFGDDIFISKRSEAKGEKASESIALINAKDVKFKKEYNKKSAPYLDKSIQDKSGLKSASTEMDADNGFAGGAPASSGWYAASINIGQSNVSSLQSFQGSRVLHHNGMNYNTMGDELVCTNPKNGETKWRMSLSGDLKKVGGFMGTPPLTVGGSIIIATYTGDILIINLETGKVSKKYETGQNIRYQPIVEKGWIYVTTTNGKLIAINTKNKKLDGWPMWGANAARTNISIKNIFK